MPVHSREKDSGHTSPCLELKLFLFFFFGTEALYEMYLILSMVLISSLVQRELTRGAE